MTHSARRHAGHRDCAIDGVASDGYEFHFVLIKHNFAVRIPYGIRIYITYANLTCKVVMVHPYLVWREL